LNKEELVTAVAEKTKNTRKTTEAILSAFTDTIGEALAKDEKVTLVGFGTFQVKERSAREGRNPRTGEVLKIPAKKTPTFLPGKGLKDRIE
jgi:DNA-binding protein HU-beta